MRWIPWLAVVAAVAMAGNASAAGTYAGWISVKGKNNDDPIVLTTNPAGTSVQAIAMAARPACSNGQVVAFHRRASVRSAPGAATVLVPTRNRGGRFAASLYGAGQSTSYSFSDRGSVTAALRRTIARGTLRLTISVADRSTGNAVMQCRTPTLRWTARRERGRVYGGTSSQGEPVYMSLTRSHRMVYEFGFDWHADCAPAGFADRPDWLTDFGLRAGRFGDSFGYTDPQRNRVRGRLVGRLTRATAAGTLAITVTTPSGIACSTGTFTWRMHSG